MTSKKTINESELSNFSGSENWYRHPLNRRVVFTDGAHYVAEAGGAFWLLDEIALAQYRREVAAEAFQVWNLLVRADRSAELTCGDGSDVIVYRKAIEFTDFPLKEIKLYFANGTIYLPSEH